MIGVLVTLAIVVIIGIITDRLMVMYMDHKIGKGE
jgi:hypothetical protein